MQHIWRLRRWWHGGCGHIDWFQKSLPSLLQYLIIRPIDHSWWQLSDCEPWRRFHRRLCLASVACSVLWQHGSGLVWLPRDWSWDFLPLLLYYAFDFREWFQGSDRVSWCHHLCPLRRRRGHRDRLHWWGRRNNIHLYLHKLLPGLHRADHYRRLLWADWLHQHHLKCDFQDQQHHQYLQIQRERWKGVRWWRGGRRVRGRLPHCVLSHCEWLCDRVGQLLWLGPGLVLGEELDWCGGDKERQPSRWVRCLCGVHFHQP